MPFSIIPFLLLAIPVAEIAVFILVGGQIGILWTLALILFTAILGSILLRVQGFQILNRLRAETDAGRIPGKELGHGAMILVAGVLLLTPGFVTDTLGFLLFVPGIRSTLWRFIASRITVVQMNGHQDRGFRRYPGEADVVDLDPDEFKSGDKKEGEASPWRHLPDEKSDK